MTKKWIGTQIVLNNNVKNPLEEHNYLKKKLSLAKEKLDLDALIVWPAGQKKSLELIREICTDFQIEMYLWHPVLADISLFRIRPDQAVEIFDGSHGYGVNGCWDEIGQGGEDFLFLCPNDEQNIKKILEHYQHQILTGGFDGVFLDRTRFPSPTNGLEALYTCFCPSCQDNFQADYHEDLNHYRNQVENILSALKDMDIKDWHNCRSLTDMIFPDQLKLFFDFRKQSIHQAIKMFAHQARQMGKLVGLDLFAPSIAPLVSQDYQVLAETCDWIKPMIYCHTSGPAGLPLELSCLMKAILNLNPSLEESRFIGEISRMFGVKLPSQVNDLLKKGIPENMIDQEMQRIKDLHLPKSVKVFIGLEAVQIPGICHIDKSILEKYLSRVLAMDLEGMVLSWNLLKIPDENLEFAGDFLLKQS